MMEAARTSGMLVNFYQTTWHYNPEDSHLKPKKFQVQETNYICVYVGLKDASVSMAMCACIMLNFAN
jgi:hypothetical protein